jgi:GT2 family glycosyltransferase
VNDKLIPSDPKDLLSAAESARQFLANCQDRSVYSNAVHHYTQLSATGQHRPDINLDPAKANLARIIDLNAISRVLLVDWHESVLPRFLAEQGIQVVVYPADEEIGDLVETHCQGLATAEVMDYANAAKTAFNMDGLGVFDLIYTRWDATSVSEPPLAQLERLAPLLTKDTVLFLVTSAIPSDKANRVLLSALSESRAYNFFPGEVFHAFPSLEHPQLLVRQGFLESTPDSWVHIAPYLDESGLPRAPNTVPKATVWRALQRHGEIPLQFSDRIIPFVARKSVKQEVSGTDLLHTSIARRHSGYWTKTTKPRTDSVICRQPIIPRPVIVDGQNRLESTTRFFHITGDEPYRSGRRLDEVWLEALIGTDPGRSELGQAPADNEVYRQLSSFQLLVKEYFAFLQTQLSARGQKLIDLVPGNIIFSSDGNYQAIDQEWMTSHPGFGPEEALFRGLFYFLMQNAAAITIPGVVKLYGTTYRELIEGILVTTVDIDITGLEQRVDQFEKKFQNHVSAIVDGVDFQTLIHSRINDTEQLDLGICCDFPNDIESVEVHIPLAASAGRERTRFHLSFPVFGALPSTIRLKPNPTAGAFCVDSVVVTAQSNGVETDLIRAADNSRVFEAASVTGAVPIDARDGALFATNNSPTLTFSCRSPTSPELGADKMISVLVDLSWPEAGYRLKDRRTQMNRLWFKEKALENAGKQITSLQRLNKDYNFLLSVRTAELELLKSSKVWRAAEAIRSIVYGRIFPRGRKKTQQRLAAAREQTSAPAEQAAVAPEHNVAFPILSKAGHEVQVKISVVMPVHDTPKSWLTDAVESITNQSYSHWELLIIDDGSKAAETKAILDGLDHPQITVIPSTRNLGISAATNLGIKSASGDYVAFLDHDDRLALGALAEVAGEIIRSKADVLYTDEIIFGDASTSVDTAYFGHPHLKPDYSPALLLSHNYITHLLVVRKKLLDEVGGTRSEFDGAQDYDLLLRLTEKTDKVTHIPKPLYHWRQSAQSTALDSAAKPAAHHRAQKALEQTLSRRAIHGRVLTANRPHYFRVQHEIIGEPLVSIIIPFRDQPRLLFECIDALNRCTRYQNYEVIGIDNSSEDELTKELMARLPNQLRVRFHRFSGPFNFSAIVNFGVQQAKGEHIVLLNNDIQVINNDWLEAMLEHSQHPSIGAVGAKLFYPDNTIQHAGIIVGIGGYAGHSHKHRAGNDPGYFNRLNIVQNVSAVTGAMLMCKKSIYEKVGGFDAENFAIAGNDVDFCLRLAETGLRNVFTPYAMAYHAESISRGYEDDPEKMARFDAEKQRFRVRHAGVLQAGDPYYNPNFRLDTEGFDIKLLSGNESRMEISTPPQERLQEHPGTKGRSENG